jgi:hypothetical protein
MIALSGEYGEVGRDLSYPASGINILAFPAQLYSP